CTDEQFPSEAVRALGYHSVLFGQKSYNGVAILSRAEPQRIERGFLDGEDDAAARVVSATVAGVRVASVYAPNGQAVDSPAYHQKLEWYGRFRRWLEVRHRKDEPLVVGGDFNGAPEDRDVWDPKLWEGQTLFSLPERAALKRAVEYGLEDTFRRLHPEPGRYSWWDYRMLGFPKNRGLRLDHIYATAPLVAQLQAAGIDREARKGVQPSDHAPVWARFRLPGESESPNDAFGSE
ncbi:MAG TPA: exodeoxyribonuclease III, partial [Myxococcaceae bacterium]|nr:exodeoxyribonuclease III [Myxococcaceae bacterium]